MPEPFIEDARCEAVRSDLAELALGTLIGRDRVRTLRHLESCPACAAELEQLVLSADALLALAPRLEPPAGFELSVMEKMRAAKPSRPRRARLLVAAAVLAVLGLGVGLGAAIFASTPTTSPPRVASLVLGGQYRGDVVLTSSGSSWMTVTVNGVQPDNWMTCEVALRSGAMVEIGRFWSNGAVTSWSTKLPVSVQSIDAVEILSGNGRPVATAHLS